MRHVGIVLLFILAGAFAFAAVPPMINYQGKLLKPDGTAVADGAQTMEFAIYDVPTGGRAIWWETNPNVQVKKGLFSVLLGSIVNLPANVFDSPNRWFGVKVGDDAEMTPRQQVTTTAFAFKAAVADTVVDGAVTTAKLASDVSDVLVSGWIPANETWTYASATNITVPTGAASKYSVGDKIKITQTTVKYFYITAVSDTSLTITAGTDYTLTNIAITTPNYSHASSPVGFPQWFNWIPVADVTTIDNASGGQPTLSNAKFRITGREVHAHFKCIGTKVTTNKIFMFSIPVACSGYTGNDMFGSFYYEEIDGIGSCTYQGSPTSTKLYYPTAINDNTNLTLDPQLIYQI